MRTHYEQHGLSNDPLYKVWETMRDRCNNPNNDNFKWYGGRGIKVCEEWNLFSNFYRDMHPRPDGMQLDRIDNEKGYSKENCHWTTATENLSNRRSCVYVDYKGQRMTLTQAAAACGVSRRALKVRLDKGDPDPFRPPIVWPKYK